MNVKNRTSSPAVNKAVTSCHAVFARAPIREHKGEGTNAYQQTSRR